jgi:hypothetical protein
MPAAGQLRADIYRSNERAADCVQAHRGFRAARAPQGHREASASFPGARSAAGVVRRRLTFLGDTGWVFTSAARDL